MIHHAAPLDFSGALLCRKSVPLGHPRSVGGFKSGVWEEPCRTVNSFLCSRNQLDMTFAFLTLLSGFLSELDSLIAPFRVNSTD